MTHTHINSRKTHCSVIQMKCAALCRACCFPRTHPFSSPLPPLINLFWIFFSIPPSPSQHSRAVALSKQTVWNMDMGEVLIITPRWSVGVCICACWREEKRGEQEREKETEEETMCQRHHPPPGSVTGGRGRREKNQRKAPRQWEREGRIVVGVWVRVCVCV